MAVYSDGSGDVLFYGRGAGKLPTASAVVGDIIDCLKHQGRIIMIGWDDCTDTDYVVPYKTTECSMYVRIKADEAESMKPEISEKFGRVLYLERNGRPDDELAFITPNMRELEIDAVLTEIGKHAEVESKIRLM